MLCLIPALVTTIVYGEHLAAQEINQVIEHKEAKTLPLVSRFETNLLDTISLIEITANQDSVTSPPNASLISTHLHGIGETDEMGKRSVAKKILYNKNDIDTVFYVLPNGDMYMIEPYQRQLDVTSTNFAFRDWYVGLMKTNKTYVSELFSPQGKNYNTIGIVTPVKSTSGEFLGIWGALINLDDWTGSFLDIKLNKNERVFLVDHKGNIIIDSENRSYTTVQSLLNLKSVNEVLGRKSGSLIEKIDNTEMFVIFRPIAVGNHSWGIIVVEPHTDVLSGVNSIRLYYTIIVAIMLVATLTALIIVKNNIKEQIVWSHETEKIWQMEDFPSKEIGLTAQDSTKSRRLLVAFVFIVVLTISGVFYVIYLPPFYDLGEVKTAFVIQNLRGDTVDTWVSWKIQPEDPFHIHVVDSDELTEARLKIINDVINSKEMIIIDDSLLHKGPKGTSSFYYLGWRGALESLSDIKTKYVIPKNLHYVMTDKGDGHVVIRLSDLKNSDGYLGYTKSYVDEENRQILKSIITIYDINNISDEQLSIILRHEIGHSLGLGHSTAPEDLMAPQISTPYPYISECALRALVDLYNGNEKSQFVCEK